MKKVFMIHGFESWPNRGFFPWLMSQLFQKAKIFAVSLEMPNPELPIAKEWVKKISDEVKISDQSTYLVGHSLGVPAILRYLETLEENQKIGAVFLVAGFSNKLNVDNLDSDIRKIDNFFDKPFDFDRIKKVCNKFYVIHGKKDPIVPVSEALLLSNILGTDPFLLEESEHFQSSKIFELPELLEIMLREIV